jgi:hypothetical protein
MTVQNPGSTLDLEKHCAMMRHGMNFCLIFNELW